MYQISFEFQFAQGCPLWPQALPRQTLISLEKDLSSGRPRRSRHLWPHIGRPLPRGIHAGRMPQSQVRFRFPYGVRSSRRAAG